MTLEEVDVLSTLSAEEFKYIIDDPVRFDLFFYGVVDHWYQAPVIRDEHDSIAAVFGRQTGKTDIVARRENYNAAINVEEALEAVIIAPAQRQSENLYGRCKKYLNKSPILLSQLKHNRVLQKGIEWENGYTIRNLPVGQSADTTRGFTLDELVYEEDGFIPGSVHEAMEDSLLSSSGVEVRIGTPNGKVNFLYKAFESAFRIYTIPQEKWESWQIYSDDMVVRKVDVEDEDIAFSCHHYPSHVGLNCFKSFDIYPEEVWKMQIQDRRFKKKYRGWIVIKTEQKQYIGQLLTEYKEVYNKLPQEVSLKYKNIHDLLDSPVHATVGFPQISPKRLKKALTRARSTVERENLALFSDEDGTVFPYDYVQRAFDTRCYLWEGPLKGYDYYAGLDLAKGVNRDWTVITIVA